VHNPLHWLYQQSGGVLRSGCVSCYLCGGTSTETHAVSKTVADTFNSHYLAQCPSSSWVCDACAWYLDNSGVHPDFRKMSLIVQRDSWQNWQRPTMKHDVTQWLTFGLDGDAYLVVSLSKKKHILMQAPLNVSSSRDIAVQVEENVAFLSLWQWEAMDGPFLRLLALGHGKGEILSGNLYGQTLRKHGQLMEALRLNQELEPYRKSPQIELLSYVTIVEERTQDDDRGTGTTGISERARTEASGVSAARSRVEEDRPRVQEQVPSRDLAAIRGEAPDLGTDYAQLDLFSQ